MKRICLVGLAVAALPLAALVVSPFVSVAGTLPLDWLYAAKDYAEMVK